MTDPDDQSERAERALIAELPPSQLKKQHSRASADEPVYLAFEDETLFPIEGLRNPPRDRLGRKLRGGLPNQTFDQSGIPIGARSG